MMNHAAVRFRIETDCAVSNEIALRLYRKARAVAVGGDDMKVGRILLPILPRKRAMIARPFLVTK